MLIRTLAFTLSFPFATALRPIFSHTMYNRLDKLHAFDHGSNVLEFPNN